MLCQGAWVVEHILEREVLRSKFAPQAFLQRSKGSSSSVAAACTPVVRPLAFGLGICTHVLTLCRSTCRSRRFICTRAR